MGPELSVGLALSDPVAFHVLQKVVASELRDILSVKSVMLWRGEKHARLRGKCRRSGRCKAGQSGR